LLLFVVETKTDAPKYTILDVWNDPESKKIFNYDTEATSTDEVIVVKIKNFEYIYKAILEDEKVFTWLAKNKYSYFKMGPFSDTTVQNINMRVADGETGPFVYGYVDQNYLIIANSISSYIKTYKSLKQ
jgi:hypothetical protein